MRLVAPNPKPNPTQPPKFTAWSNPSKIATDPSRLYREREREREIEREELILFLEKIKKNKNGEKSPNLNQIEWNP